MEFNKKEHKYFHNGEEYKSVSSLISKVVPEFDEDIGRQKALKEGKQEDYYLKQWKINSEISCDFGNAIDKAITLFVDYGVKHKHPHILKAVNSFDKATKGKEFKTQTILFSEEYKIAGTADLIEKHGNKEVSIWDVKTNADLNKKAYGYMLAPMKNYKNDIINKYRLQLSLYAYMAEKVGLKVRDLNLIHWDGEKFEKIELERIKNIEELLKIN